MIESGITAAASVSQAVILLTGAAIGLLAALVGRMGGRW